MSETMSELIKRHRLEIAFRIEFYKAWKSSGSPLSQDEWVKKHLPEKYDAYLDARRVAEIVNAECDRLDQEHQATMSELEKLHEKLMTIAIEIQRAWACSGSHLKKEKWVAKYMPEKLEVFHQADRVFWEVMEERRQLKAQREQSEEDAKG